MYANRDAGLRNRVRKLSPHRCQELLEASHVGRIGWNGVHGPQIFPVSYVVHDDQIVFRTSSMGVLSELTRRTPVVFEIDGLDLDQNAGWSVLVRGRSGGIASPAQLVTLWTVDGPTPWGDGIRNVFVGITAEQLTGRAFGDIGTRA
jgi:nitroimidazol reductase NimA-like FMN-containing flavoprotein (pyridoxamine 5'-phosphate oxidase superfamily)